MQIRVKTDAFIEINNESILQESLEKRACQPMAEPESALIIWMKLRESLTKVKDRQGKVYVLAQDLKESSSCDTFSVDLPDVKGFRERRPGMELRCGTCEDVPVYQVQEEDTTVRVKNMHSFGERERPA